MNDVAKALGDPAAEARAAAAWALSQRGTAGPAAAKAIPGRVKALDDPSPSVRAVAADALGNLGPAGKPVVETLGRHLLGANESVVFVLRSLAEALGNIGPGAASALPALEQALKMHRVSYATQEAILKIRGEQVPVWY